MLISRRNLKSLPKKEATSEEDVIILRPKLEWPTRPIPLALPTNVPHGGVLSNRFQLNPKKEAGAINSQSYFMKIYIPGVGSGVGAIVSTGKGPILIGSTSLMTGLMGSFTFWLILICLLLLLSAIIWAVTNRCRHDFYPSTYSALVPVNSLDNKYIETTKLGLTTQQPAAANGFIFSSQQSKETNRLLTVINKDEEIQSVFSFTSQITTGGSISIANTVFSQASDKVAESPRYGRCYSVSCGSAPSVWYLENGLEMNNVLANSPYKECTAVFLCNEEQYLIGLMRWSPRLSQDVTSSTRYVQVWNTQSGLLMTESFFLECQAACVVKDRLLATLEVHSTGLTVRIWNVGFDLQLVADALGNVEMDFARMMLWHGMYSGSVGVSSIWIANGGRTGNNNSIPSLVPMQLHRIILPDSVGMTSGSIRRLSIEEEYNGRRAIVVLDKFDRALLIFAEGEAIFHDRQHAPLVLGDGQQILGVVISTDSSTLALLHPNGISILDFPKLSVRTVIPVSQALVCSVGININYVAIALESGRIVVWNTRSSSNISLNILKPITHLQFRKFNNNIIALSDKASSYKLFFFPLPSDI